MGFNSAFKGLILIMRCLCQKLCYKQVINLNNISLYNKVKGKGQRLRWSRGSVLAIVKPGRSRRIFKAKKILSTPSFGGEVKPSVPCRNFTACKRSLNVRCKSAFRQNYRTFLAHSSTFAAGCSRLVTRVETPGGES